MVKFEYIRSLEELNIGMTAETILNSVSGLLDESAGYLLISIGSTYQVKSD